MGGKSNSLSSFFLSRGAKIALYLSFICPFQFFLSSLLLVFGESRSNFLFHSTTTFALLSSILTSLFSLKFYFNTVSTLLFDFYSFYFENFTQGSQKKGKIGQKYQILVAFALYSHAKRLTHTYVFRHKRKKCLALFESPLGVIKLKIGTHVVEITFLRLFSRFSENHFFDPVFGAEKSIIRENFDDVLTSDFLTCKIQKKQVNMCKNSI